MDNEELEKAGERFQAFIFDRLLNSLSSKEQQEPVGKWRAYYKYELAAAKEYFIAGATWAVGKQENK